MEPTNCPICGSSMLVAGEAVGWEVQVRFRPGAGPSPQFAHGIAIACHACMSCGFVRFGVPPQDLRSFITAHGPELLRQHLSRLELGEYHDVPDSAQARQAADRVAEVDGLLMAGKTLEATRRYRELSGATWDETHELMPQWPLWKRPQKLARMGWIPREKTPAAGHGMVDHPMADRWLDGLPVERPRGDGVR